LSEAIDSLQGSDPVKLMLQDIQVILGTDDDGDSVEKKSEALENLQMHTEDVDLANGLLYIIICCLYIAVSHTLCKVVICFC